MKSKNSKQYRNEIKYLLNGVSREALFIQYKISSLLLSKLHPDRWVNNIYFDNINLDLFNQSIEGMSRRAKVRLRWYGDFYNIEKPILELKLKSGYKNMKKTLSIKDKFIYKNNLQIFYNNLINSKGLNDKYRYLLKELRPVLANRYFRSYHSSADNKYRITTDTNLNFANLITSSLTSIIWKKQKDTSIVEIKFQKTNKNITNFMTELRSRYRMSQISKYTHGLQL